MGWVLSLSGRCAGKETRAWTFLAQQPRQSCEIYPDKPRLKICKKQGSLYYSWSAWPEATLADRAQFHSWQSVSVSTGPCVSPRAITQQCAESKSLRELKDAPSARRWLHNPLDKDRKQIQVSASSTPSLTRPACRLEGRFGIRLATMRSISN